MRHGLRWIKRGLLMGILLLAFRAVSADGTLRDIERQYGLDPDFATNLRVEMIGHRLAEAAELPHINFHIIVSDELNAFAFPDGNIYVSSGMARRFSDAELAFVLGHEMTHVQEGHGNKLVTQSIGGALLGALLAVALGGREVGISMGADLGKGLSYGHYSRGDEQRADAGGVRLMSRLGYEPQDAAAAMQRLLEKYGRGDANTFLIGWFADHPDTQERKDRITKYAEQLAKNPLPPLPPPLGIEFTLDPSAEHARTWLGTYLALACAVYCQGKAEVLLPTPVVSPETAAPRS